MTESLPSHTSEPGRIARYAMPANRTGWTRWLPGLNTLRRYESSWLRHDLVAGLVMTTMLVPVGIAYAEAFDSYYKGAKGFVGHQPASPQEAPKTVTSDSSQVFLSFSLLITRTDVRQRGQKKQMAPKIKENKSLLRVSRSDRHGK
jgi:hypothetical protein